MRNHEGIEINMILLVVISIFLGLIGNIVFKKWHNPVTIFSYLWALIFFFYILNLRDYYIVSTKTEIIFTLQMIGFAFGGFCAHHLYYGKANSIKETNTCYELRIKAYLILCIITIIVLLGDTIVVIENLLAGMTFEEMAQEDVFTENSATGIMVFIKIFITFPVINSISAITATEILFRRETKQKYRWLLLVANVVIVLLHSLQHGARVMLITFFVIYFFVYLFSGKHNLQSKKAKRLIKWLCIAVPFLIFYMSLSRGIEMSRLGISIYHYLTGCVPHLHVILEKIEFDFEHTLGFASLNGFISPINILLNGLGIISRSPYLSRVASNYISLPEVPSDVGNNVGMNAFVGPSYTMYLDFGFFGVLLGMFIYGYVCAYLYKKAQKTDSNRTKSLYFILLSTLCVSFMRFSFCQYFVPMSVILTTLLYERKKKQ